jgi:hypothetical protein
MFDIVSKFKNVENKQKEDEQLEKDRATDAEEQGVGDTATDN